MFLLSFFFYFSISCVSFFFNYSTYISWPFFYTSREYALKYHGVHCSWISLGQSLVKEGHVDNFLIPCFCRKLFEEKHPSKSGRHYFFSCIGVCIHISQASFFRFHTFLFFVHCLAHVPILCVVIFLFFVQESILELSNSVHESIVRTSLLGAASASRGKRLDFSDQVRDLLFFSCYFVQNMFIVT